MNIAFRKLHRKIAPIIFLPLLASALTGVVYRLGESWWGMPEQIANVLMVIHQGEYLGAPLVPIYVFLVGLGLLGAIATGLTMITRRNQRSQKQAQPSARYFHRFLAPIIFLPLIVTALTGMAYRLGRSWLRLSDGQAEIFLRIHQASYLGPFGRDIYVLLLGIGLVAMLFTGISAIGRFGKRSQIG
jgi:uncharacterized iron-regulated membrane protein